MIRKLTILLLLLALLAPALPVAADTLPQTNTGGKPLNMQMLKAYHWLIYGDPAKVPGNEQKAGEWRYLGYTFDGNLFSNPYFPNDADSGRDAWQKDWVSLPWTVKAIADKYSLNKASLNDDDQADQWIGQLTPAWPGWDTSKLLDTLVILSPPGKDTPGAARGFHMVGGKLWYQTFVLAPYNDYGVMLDLAVDNFALDSDGLVAGESYTGKADISNYMGQDLQQVPIRLYFDGESVLDDKIDIPTQGTEFNFNFTLPADYTNQTFSARIELNMVEPRTYEEINTLDGSPMYDNNTAELSLGLIPPDACDLEVTKIVPGQFFTGQAGDVVIYVRNNGSVDVTGVPVRLLIDGQAMTPKTISLAPGASTQVLYKVTPPSGSTGFAVVGEVNHTRKYTETTYSNNTRSATVTITAPAAPPNCSNPTVTWTEYRSKDAYSSGNIVERHYIQVRHTERKSYTRADGTTGHRTRVWYTQELVGYTVKFTTTLHASVAATPGKIKSGYGVDTTVKTWITTNYDREGSLSNAQNVWAYFPDSGTPVKLQAVSGSPGSASGTVTWRLPENSKSVLRARKHYIPVSWPDGSYQIRIIATDVAGPGDPCRSVSTTITIQGNMYEDDYTD